MKNIPLVSVICKAYNHEKYIRKCLDGFISQKTNFPFQVIIHDDASTDNTANIIHEYELKYPNIILPIYEKDNQWSKGKKIVREFIYPYIKGKYIASCEGDDYWCDPLKLQKQIDALEKNKTCRLCLHKVRQISEDGKIKIQTMPNFNLKTGKYTTEEFLQLDEGHNFQTSSYFCHEEDYRKYILSPPVFRLKIKEGDVQFLLFFSTLGDIYYYNDIMSCHRQESKGSWSESQKYSSIEKKIKHQNTNIQIFNLFNEFTDFKYNEIIQHRINKTIFDKFLIQKQYKKALQPQYLDFFKKLSLKRKIIIYLGAISPSLIDNICLFINKIRNRY